MPNITQPKNRVGNHSCQHFCYGSSQKPIHRIKQFDFDYPNERLACEHPQRQIYLSQFEIGIYLVTNHQFGFSVDNAGYQAGRELD
ncbi:hypothetical protein CMK16_15375, partial [Candidatus Poribacteria bacterium]|nr:hypothetical protein [Candidatus Poribacteria bacterium]